MERGFQQQAPQFFPIAQSLAEREPALTQAGGEYQYALDDRARQEQLGAESSRAAQIKAMLDMALQTGQGLGGMGRAAGQTTSSTGTTYGQKESPFETALRFGTGMAGAAAPFFMPGMPFGSALPGYSPYNLAGQGMPQLPGIPGGMNILRPKEYT